MRVHAFTTDRGGCFHYRIRQPLTYLRKLGHWTSWGSGVDFETWDRATVLVNQFLHLPETRDNWVRWCEEGEKLCVWEADDDITCATDSPHHGNAYDDPETLPRMTRMIEASHLVTTTTEALAGVYRKFNPNVVVLPNVVPDWLVDVPMAPEGNEPLVMGYTGSASHLNDYLEWSPVLEAWMRRNSPRTVLRYWGLSSRPEGMPRSWVAEVNPWVKQTDEYLRGLRMDVGVAPLLDTVFNRGKSGIKAVEYAALGIPAVVADLKQYRDVVVPGETGFLARSKKEWLDALNALWDDKALRARMGLVAREHVRHNFLASHAAPEWERAYMEAGERIGINV